MKLMHDSKALCKECKDLGKESKDLKIQLQI